MFDENGTCFQSGQTTFTATQTINKLIVWLNPKSVTLTYVKSGNKFKVVLKNMEVYIKHYTFFF